MGASDAPDLPRGLAYNRASAAKAARASGPLVRNTVVMIVLAILAAATWVATWERQDASAAGRTRHRRSRSATTLAARGLAAPTSKAAPTTASSPSDSTSFRRGAPAAPGVNVDYQPAGRYGVGAHGREREVREGRLAARAIGDVEVRTRRRTARGSVTIVTELCCFCPTLRASSRTKRGDPCRGLATQPSACART